MLRHSIALSSREERMHCNLQLADAVFCSSSTSGSTAVTRYNEHEQKKTCKPQVKIVATRYIYVSYY